MENVLGFAVFSRNCHTSEICGSDGELSNGIVFTSLL